MPRQPILFVRTNSFGVKAKGFSSLLGAFAVVRHGALLCFRQFCW